ncbi:hypothetical protein ACI2KR_07710 [Pseudomonas luteola]
MDTNFHYEAIRALKNLSATAIDTGNGYIAVAFFADLSKQAEQLIKECFFCFVDDSRLYVAVCDNGGNPLSYMEKAKAESAALAMVSSLEKKFVFNIFRYHGIKLDIKEEAVVNFVIRRQK